MGAKEPTEETGRPLLMVDIDGVISLFGFAGRTPWTGHSGMAGGSGESADGSGTADGCYATIDGIPHFLSRAAADHLLELSAEFDLVWASGWEEKAEEYLPRLLGVPAGLPFLRFERTTGLPPTRGNEHWKLAAIETYAGARPLAWIDDAFDHTCHAWADARAAPTLLVQTAPARGLTSTEVSQLTMWSRSL